MQCGALSVERLSVVRNELNFFFAAKPSSNLISCCVIKFNKSYLKSREEAVLFLVKMLMRKKSTVVQATREHAEA